MLFTFNEVKAQEHKTKDQVVVILKSGTTFSGAIKEWQVGEYIIIESDSGNEYTFKGDTIEKVVEMKLYEQNIKKKYERPKYIFLPSGSV